MTDAVGDRVEHTDALERRLRDLEGRLHRRAAIEQAKGVLCAWHCIDPEQAFDLLRDRSRNSNMPLAEVAADLVATASSRSDTTTITGRDGVRRMLDALPVAVLQLRRVRTAEGEAADFEIEYANRDAAEAIAGGTVGRLLGRRLRKLAEEAAMPQLWDTCLEAAGSGLGVRDGDVSALPVGDGQILLAWR